MLKMSKLSFCTFFIFIVSAAIPLSRDDNQTTTWPITKAERVREILREKIRYSVEVGIRDIHQEGRRLFDHGLSHAKTLTEHGVLIHQSFQTHVNVFPKIYDRTRRAVNSKETHGESDVTSEITPLASWKSFLFSRDSKYDTNKAITTKKRALTGGNSKGKTQREYLFRDPLLSEYTTCEHITGYQKHRWLSVVTSCPGSWTNQTVRVNCEGWKYIRGKSYIGEASLLPAEDKAGNVFANIFCAECHDIKKTYSWYIEVSCRAHDLKRDFQNDFQSLSKAFFASTGQAPGCKSYIHPANQMVIRNCSDRSISKNSRRMDYMDQPVSSSYPVSFNVLMNFDFLGNTHLLFSAGQRIYTENSNKPRCKPMETFDPYKNKCRPVKCGHNHKLDDGLCKPKDNDTNTAGEFDDLSDLRNMNQAALVSLFVNITFLDYVLMQHQDVDIQKDITKQIAELLHITVSRIKNVNVTYESGTVNGSNFEVIALTDEELQANDILPQTDHTKSTPYSKHHFNGLNNTNTSYGFAFPDLDNNTHMSDEGISSGTNVYAGGLVDEGNLVEECSNDPEMSKTKVLTTIRRKRFVSDEGVFKMDSTTTEPHTSSTPSDRHVEYGSISTAVLTMIDTLSTGEGFDSNDIIYIKDRFSLLGDDSGEAETLHFLKTDTQLGDQKGTTTAEEEYDENNDKLVFSYTFFNDEVKSHVYPHRNKRSLDFETPSDEVFEDTHAPDDDESFQNDDNLDRTRITEDNNSLQPKEENRKDVTTKKIPGIKTPKRKDNGRVLLVTKGKLENGGKVKIKIKHHERKKNRKDKTGKKINEFGKYVKTAKEHFMEYHIETENITSTIYISEPVNSKDSRKVITPKCMKRSLKQPMVMKISFVLLPPADPTSNEDGAPTIVDQIYSMIIENKFSLTINGNTVDVVNADNPRKTNIAEKVFCPRGVELMVFENQFTIMTVQNTTILYYNETHTYFGVGRFDLYVSVIGNSDSDDSETEVTSVQSYAFVCVMPRIVARNCRRIDLDENEYEVLGENKSIIFENREYDVFSYTVTDEYSGKIQICVPKTFKIKLESATLRRVIAVDGACGHEFDDAAKAEGWMTQVLCRLSICALACVLVTYSLFPKLRNLPGVNTMNLTLALFVAEIIFMEGITVETHWLCIAVAICEHYFFLAAHFWMNVMSFDVYRTFTKDTILTQVRNKGKYLPRYALYAWGMPMLIVGFCIFVDFSDVFNFKINYGPAPHDSNNIPNNLTQDVASGGNSQNQGLKEITVNGTKLYYPSVDLHGQPTGCWIWNTSVSLVTFGGPILLIFFTNCIFFIRTIMSISRTTNVARKSLGQRHSNASVKKMTGRSDVMLYVRMSTVMGFTWFFGLGGSLMSSFLSKPVSRGACIISHTFSVLYNILNISQGIFIFGAFVCNRRVLALYCGLFLRIKKFLMRQSPRSKLFSLSSTNSLSSRESGISYISRDSR